MTKGKYETGVLELRDMLTYPQIPQSPVSDPRLAQCTSHPCSYYDGGIKVRTRVGQNILKFGLISVHGSFSMPTITLNILAYSDMSSLFTHLTTFKTIPFIVTYIPFLFLFSNSVFTICT